MDRKIIDYCCKTDSIKGIFDLYKKEILGSYELLSPKEKKPVLKALPYVYRMWYYSALMNDTPITPANFINMQIKEKYGEDYIAVPIARPIYKRRALSDFEQEFILFSIEKHPVLKDLELFLQSSLPDIGVEENGLLLEEEREKFIDSLTFKEIFYVTFLTNLSYELGLLKKMPSIGVYRATAITANMETFFKLTNEEQLKRIIEAVITIASKQLCEAFPLDRSVFSVSAIRKLIRDAEDLNEFINGIMDKYNLNIDIEDLESIDIENIEDIDIGDLPQESVMALAVRMELAFAMDAYLMTPLGYYLQFLQPIYIYLYDASSYFYELYNAETNNVPLIKLFFMMPNGFDLTVLGKKILLDGKKPKNEFQTLTDKIDYNEAYRDICEYNDDDSAFEVDVLDEDMKKAADSFFASPVKAGKGKHQLNSVPQGEGEIVTEKDAAYIFKVKKSSNKRRVTTFAVKASQSLKDFKEAIIRVYDLIFEGGLYSFYMNSNEDQSTSSYYPGKMAANNGVKLHQLKLYKGENFQFLHDFGDDLSFDIEFVGTETIEKGAKYPMVVPKQ